MTTIAPAPISNAPTGGAPAALDPTIVNLAKAIRETETRGSKDPYTAKGGSGEFGAYQYTPGTWSADVKAFTGKDVPLEQADKLLQNEVAYKKLESLKKQGYNVGQIASIWNSGQPEWEGKTGVNKYGVKYDVPQYVDSVAKAYQALKAGTTPDYQDTASTVGNQTVVSPQEMKDTQSGQQYGAFFPSTTGDSPIAAGAKVLGNIPSSAFGFVKNALSSLNPLNTIKTLAQIPGEVSGLVKDAGGVGNAIGAFGSSLLPTAYKSLVPEAGRGLVTAAGGAFTGNDQKIDEGLQTAQRAIVNDPVGQIAPFIFAAKGAANLADKALSKAASADVGVATKAIDSHLTSTQQILDTVPVKDVARMGGIPAIMERLKTNIVDGLRGAGDEGGASAVSKLNPNSFDTPQAFADAAKAAVTTKAPTTAFGPAVDAGISKTAGVVTKPVGYAFGKAADIARGTAKYVTSKVTGFQPETIKQITERPEDFTPEKMSTMSRKSLGDEVASKLNERIDSKAETGREYAPVRESTAPVKVDSTFLRDTLAKETGLTFKKGRFEASAKSFIDKPGDVAAVQRLYDAWQPYFKNGTMTADDFLTLRSKLAKLAYNDAGIKSGDMSTVANGARVALNSKYRPQIKGLEDLDSTFSSQAAELKTLSKGLFDRDGNLTDTAINRIANAAGKGKDALLARLEEISPGITLKIRTLKAIEDIQNINKVGTYTKSALEGGGLVGGIATGNIPLIVASITTLLLSQPEVAVRMLRGYGAQAAPLAGKVMEAIKSGAGAVNNFPDKLPGIKSGTVFGRPQEQLPSGVQ